MVPILFFPFRKKNSNKLLHKIMEKTKQLHVLPALVECHSTIASFNLWMSKVGHDIFALVIIF
jgi:hypothetical protein